MWNIRLLFTILFAVHGIVVCAQTFSYSYDPSGNRIHRQLVEMKHMESSSDTSATPPVVTQMADMSIRIFPNPTAGALRIEITNLPEQAQGSLVLWNLQGQELLKINAISANMTADLSTQPNGSYIMRITVGQEVKKWKIVKQ